MIAAFMRRGPCLRGPMEACTNTKGQHRFGIEHGREQGNRYLFAPCLEHLKALLGETIFNGITPTHPVALAREARAAVLERRVLMLLHKLSH